jgi:hypothetical protein
VSGSAVRRLIAAVTLTALAAFGPSPPRADADESEPVLRGVAQGADGPAAGALVAAGIIGWAPAAGDHVATATTDAEGRFEMQRAPLGPIDVWVLPKGGKWTFAIRMSHPGVNDLGIDARPKPSFGGFSNRSGGGGTVSGVVTDKQGKAIAGAAVGLRGDDGTWVTTDAKGEFTLKDASDGDGLVVRANGFRDAVSEVKSVKKRLAIKLDAGKPTVVRVTDPEGKPLPGAWVTLGDPDTVQSTTGFSSLFPPRPRLVGAWTDAAGEARIVWGDPEDATVATAYSPRHAPASKKITAAKSAVTLQLGAMRPVRATVTMRGSGEPVPGVYVGLPHASDGGADAISALPADAERGPVVVGRTDERGECSIPHLPADVTTLRVVGELKPRADVKIERLDAK